jgi:adenosine 3'-phospho 5'-phosphosulfate transporter B2
VFFTESAFLVLNNRVVTMVIAFGLALYNGESTAPVAPLFGNQSTNTNKCKFLKSSFSILLTLISFSNSAYAGVSLSNFVATWCQYEALKSISFPTQTLGKCGKIFPVLVLGTLGLGAKKYGRQDYIEGLFLTIGCLIFLLTGDTKAPQKAKDDSFIGLSLMALYLFSDGFTSTLQEKLFKGFTMSTYNQMIYVNGSSALLSIIALVSSGGLWTAIDFVFKYPPLFFDALVLSLCAMFGQQIIYYIIKDFGALFFATAMTTRQFVGILLSCMLFAHPLTIGQVGGTLVVAGAMYYKVFNKPPSHHGPKSAPEPSLVDKIQQAVGPAKSSGNEQGEKHSSRV